MKFIFAALALASTAFAAPSPQTPSCTPGQYACHAESEGWLVCNTSGVFEVSLTAYCAFGTNQKQYAGTCPYGDVCVFDDKNGGIYCVPPGFVIPS
jgi:hypothetical protein